MVQAAAPALHSIGTGEGDILPFIRPLDFVFFTLHQKNEIFLAGTKFHCLTNVIHQPEFPAITFLRRTVFPGAHALAAFLIGRQYGKTVSQTQLVADGTELL